MPFLKAYPQVLTVGLLAQKQKTPVYLVGGFCRDYLLKVPVLDFDFAVEKGAIAFARKFSREIKGAFVLLDEEHGCARVVKLRADGQTETYDFADFRASTIAKDVHQRDFTINTLALRVDTIREDTDFDAMLLDSQKGRKDLLARRIKMVTVSSFTQDPLRLLRAFSLQAILNFRIEPKTIARIKKDRDLIRGVSYERIRDELFKILSSPRAWENIAHMDRVGLLEKIIPQIAVMYRIRQGGYHHLDVWQHSLETLKNFENVVEEFRQDPELRAYLDEPISGDRSRQALLKLAAILHDIGKPATMRREKNKLSFHGHERVGEEAVKVIATTLKLSTHERLALQNMVRYHLRPGYLSNFKRPSPRAVFRFFRDAKREAPGIAVFSIADQRATRGPMSTKKDLEHHEKICRMLVKEYFYKQKASPFVRLITGDDLIRKLHLKPSPLFATILREVEEYQAAGKITDKKMALDLAQKIAARFKGEKKV